MRIISRKKDYYDSALSQGFDPSIVFLREEREEVLKGWIFPSLSIRSCTYYSLDWQIIGFCGTIYPCLFGPSPDSSDFDNTQYFYSMKEVDEYFKSKLSSKKYDIYRGECKRERRGSTTVPYRQEYVDFFELCSKYSNTSITKKLFIENRSPIFVAKPSRYYRCHGTIYWNCLLRGYGFQKVLNPYIALQEISMFLANLAAPEKPMPIISDELKIQSKGFDKWSFRRKPGE